MGFMMNVGSEPSERKGRVDMQVGRRGSERGWGIGVMQRAGRDAVWDLADAWQGGGGRGSVCRATCAYCAQP
eukprot:6088763-Prymnesium_polylepis.1